MVINNNGVIKLKCQNVSYIFNYVIIFLFIVNYVTKVNSRFEARKYKIANLYLTNGQKALLSIKMK